jgi:hypothetical protein
LTGKGANEKTDREAHVKRIMAFQVSQGELPYPLLPPIPQPGYVFATRLVLEDAPQPTGDATAASSTEVPEEAAHSTTPPTDQEFRNECAAYRRHQDMFAADLCKIIVRPERRTEFQSLLGRSGRKLRPYNYEQAARLAHRDKGWRPQTRLLELLVSTIHGCEKVQEWKSRLPADDARHARAADQNHGKAYVRQEEAPRRRPAAQAAQRQLPSEVVQPMQADYTGEQRS